MRLYILVGVLIAVSLPTCRCFFSRIRFRNPVRILRPIIRIVRPVRPTIRLPIPPTIRPRTTPRPRTIFPFPTRPRPTIRPRPRPTPRPKPTTTTTPAIPYKHNILAPTSFRVGATEIVILNLYLYPTATVSAYLTDLPRRQAIFNQIPARTLNAAACNQPIQLEFKVNDNNIRSFRKNQKIEMVIEVSSSPADFTESIEVDTTKESGYLFIQTDRPIYRPSESVEIRVFPLEQDMSPERDNLVEIIVKTPDGIGAYREVQRLAPFGFVETIFFIAEYPMYGTWSVQAKFLSEGYNTTSEAKFVIRKYVLPTFDVKIDLSKNFFRLTDQAISGYIRANYSYGEPVEGNYFLTMKLKRTPTSEPIEFYKMPGAGSYLVTAPFEHGEYFFNISIDDLLDDLNPGETLEDLADNSATVSIEATVNARADGVMESDISPDIPFLKTPYSIDTSTSSKFYTPGLSYSFEAIIRYVTTGDKAPRIPITVQVGKNAAPSRLESNDEGEISTRFDFIGTNSQVDVSEFEAAHAEEVSFDEIAWSWIFQRFLGILKTLNPSVAWLLLGYVYSLRYLEVIISTDLDDASDDDQSSVTITVVPYSSTDNKYLQVNIPHGQARVGQGDYFLTFRYRPSPPSQIRFIVLARGATVSSGINTPKSGSTESTQRLDITQSMVPAARVVAYYVSDTELVSASIWLDVEDQCKHELSVQAPKQVLPGAAVPFTVRGQPLAQVAMSGVDKAAYFLHQQERLTRNSMFSEMDSFDRGCVRSGGSNSRDVFTGAGLNIYGISLPYPSSPACAQPSSRKKRNVFGVFLEEANERTRKLAQCERDGKRENLAGEDCETRGRRCRDNYEDQYPGCWKRFRDACFKAARERLRKEHLGLNGTGNQAEAEASVEERREAFQDESSPWTVTLVEGAEPLEVEIPQVVAAAVRPPPARPAPARPLSARRPAPAAGPFKQEFAASINSQFFALAAFKPATQFLTTTSRPTTTTTTTTTTAAPAPTKTTGLFRSHFRERLSWPNIQIKSNGERRFVKRAQDSITTFVIDAVGMHDSPDGFCVAPSTELRVFKDVFVQLNTPYSLKRREQVDLRIVIFNYNRVLPQDLIVRVRLENVFCSQFKPETWSELIRMQIEPGGSGSASVSLLPLRIPEGIARGRIEVEIRTLGNVLVDSIQKEVLIEPEGEIKYLYQTFPLDLKTQNQDNFVINFTFPEEFVPDTRQCWLYGYTNFMGPSIEVDEISKEPRDIKSIFRMPYGCGEQNMLVTGPNVYAHMYLTAVGKLTSGYVQYEQSIMRMQDGCRNDNNVYHAGFNRELQYRSEAVNLRAWAVFKHYLPSTWLNAFVDRVFIKAKLYYTDLDETAICNSLDWLLGEQDAEGYFRERRPPLHREMHGAVGGRLSLTTYVLITLVDSEGVCSPQLTANVVNARSRAVAFLQANKNDVAFQRTYGLALLSYALSLHDPTSDFAREINARLLALKQYTADMRQVYWQGRPHSDIEGTDIHAYWYKKRPQAIDVEATAYALLAQIEFAKATPPVGQSELDLTRKTVLWLISQRNEAGAFISTQDTVVGLQALATYQIWINQVEPQPAVVSINVTLESRQDTEWEASSRHSFLLDERNEGLRKEVEVPDDVMQSGSVNVHVQGTGEGVLSYKCIYRSVVDEDACHFLITQDVSILNEGVEGGAPKTIKLTITVSKPIGAQAEASIIEVGLLSGFSAVQRSLERLAIADVVDGTVERYEITNQNVILYMNRIGRDTISFAFTLEQRIVVDHPQPAKINIYDYYEPSIRCGTFYSLPGHISELRTANCDTNNDALCQCAEGVCPVCRTREQQLTKTLCLTFEGIPCEICNGPEEDCDNMFTKACRSNYVYIVNITHVDEVTTSTVFASFRAVIVDIYKVGSEDTQRNEERTFVTRNDCHELCRDPSLVREGNEERAQYLRPGSYLLIMGPAPEPPSLDRNGRLASRYRLEEGTFMERVIVPERCVRLKRNYDRLKCGDLTHPRNPSQEEKCMDYRKLHESCKNQKRLKDQLRQGCGK